MHCISTLSCTVEHLSLHVIRAHHCMRSSVVNEEPERDASVIEGDTEAHHFCEFCSGSIGQTPEQKGKHLSILHPLFKLNGV
jgi:hypothetical protein